MGGNSRYFNAVDYLPSNLRQYVGGTNTGYSSRGQATTSMPSFGQAGGMRRPFTPMTGMFSGGFNPYMYRSPFQFRPAIGRGWMMPPIDYNQMTQEAAGTPPAAAAPATPAGNPYRVKPAKPPPPAAPAKKEKPDNWQGVGLSFGHGGGRSSAE